MRFSRTRLSDVLHRRRSAVAFQGRKGLGAMTVPHKVINPRCSVVGSHRHPCSPPDVFAVDLVLQRVNPSIWVGLGRPVQRVLQRFDSVASDSRQGGPSRDTGTHQSAAPNMRANEAAALPSPRVVLSRGSTSVK